MEMMGIEPGLLLCYYLVSAEATKFVSVVKEVTDAIKALGPNQTFVKTKAKVA